MRLPLKRLCDIFWRLKPRIPSKLIQFHPVLLQGVFRSLANECWHICLYFLSLPVCWRLSSSTVSHACSSSSQSCLSAPKQLQQWLSCHAGLSPRLAKVLAWTLWSGCSMALTNRSCSPSLTLDCAAAKEIQAFSSKEFEFVPNGGHKILEAFEAFHK